MEGTVTHFSTAQNSLLTPYTLPLLIWDVIDNQWNHRDVDFTESWPRTTVEKPTIVWRIYRRVPGKEGLETRKPRFRGQTQTADPTITEEQWAQWHTIIYEFAIYDVSNSSVNSLTEEFEDLMYNITPILKSQGAGEWLFDEQVADEELARESSQELYRRILRYRCILERKYIKSVPNIMQIFLRSIHSYFPVEDEQVTRGSLTNRDTLTNKWVYQVTRCGILQDKHQTTVIAAYDEIGSDYLINIDFKVGLLIDGTSYIEWVSGAKHPKPGDTYYITYTYRNNDPLVPMTP